jgi:hypothetical protein
MKFEEKKYIIGNLTSIFMNLRCCNRKKKNQQQQKHVIYMTRQSYNSITVALDRGSIWCSINCPRPKLHAFDQFNDLIVNI